jgi:hypothetical protein
MASMKKLAIMDTHQKVKSFTPEMEEMILKRDQRPEASTRSAHIQAETILHPRLVHKPRVLFQDITCRDLMKPCLRIMFQNHKSVEDLKFLE